MIVETERHANTWTSGKAVRGHKGVGMEGFIASWYARQTAKDMDRFTSLARRLASQIGRDLRVLEIAPGPGYLAIELAKLTGCRMIGVRYQPHLRAHRERKRGESRRRHCL